MKILYGIQCTGNGHITRSIDLINELRKYAEVDVLTSGSHSEVTLPFDVRFSLKGLSFFFGRNGSFDIYKTALNNNLFRFAREVEKLPIKEYNMVISDFEPVSAWSAKRNDVYSVALSNQASLTYSDVPKPPTSHPISKWLIRSFCPSKQQYGLYYEKYNSKLFHPPIRQKVRNLTPHTGEHYVVYLPFYGDERIIENLSAFPEHQWKVFSKHAKQEKRIGSIHLIPINEDEFLNTIQGCRGVMCSAGFGTTTEALFLHKKLLVIPMKSQYEQICNSYTLAQIGVPVIKSLKPKHHEKIGSWLENGQPVEVQFQNENRKIIQQILTDYISYFETT